MAEVIELLGKVVNLITVCGNRYEGLLRRVDYTDCTVLLADVQFFGTEDRECNIFSSPMDGVFDGIMFNIEDIVHLSMKRRSRLDCQFLNTQSESTLRQIGLSEAEFNLRMKEQQSWNRNPLIPEGLPNDPGILSNTRSSSCMLNDQEVYSMFIAPQRDPKELFSLSSPSDGQRQNKLKTARNKRRVKNRKKNKTILEDSDEESKRKSEANETDAESNSKSKSKQPDEVSNPECESKETDEVSNHESESKETDKELKPKCRSKATDKELKLKYGSKTTDKESILKCDSKDANVVDEENRDFAKTKNQLPKPQMNSSNSKANINDRVGEKNLRVSNNEKQSYGKDSSESFSNDDIEKERKIKEIRKDKNATCDGKKKSVSNYKYDYKGTVSAFLPCSEIEETEDEETEDEVYECESCNLDQKAIAGEEGKKSKEFSDKSRPLDEKRIEKNISKSSKPPSCSQDGKLVKANEQDCTEVQPLP